jgi:HAD superfamily hydrolase (TIGR01549 family)
MTMSDFGEGTSAKEIQAMLFDLDGTLYRQGPLRWRMLLALARESLKPGGRRTLRAIRVFRQMREELRDLGAGQPDLYRAQYERPAQACGMPAAELQALVEDWMMRRPLPLLRAVTRPELPKLLDALDERGIRVGVFSDYPAAEKLAALGLAGRFEPVLAATDAEIHAFKPHPAGLLHACKLWGLEPGQVLYVGDRPELDAEAARRAGMLAAIIGKAPRGVGAGGYLQLQNLLELIDAL